MDKSIPIKTKYAEVIEFTVIDHGERGSLQVAESGKHVPFPIKRTYVLSGVGNGLTRGGHAHKTFDQVIVPLRGSFVLMLDDGETTQELHLDNPAVGIRIRPRLWHTMSNFSPDAVIIVFADQHYKEDDYLREYEQWQDYIKENPDHDSIQ